MRRDESSPFTRTISRKLIHVENVHEFNVLCMNQYDHF